MKRGHLSECGVCGSNQGLLLHNVRHRGTYRRLCTNCILKCHQGLFCPICLQVYDTSPPPPHARLMCVKCPSICHLSCSSSSPTSAFVCPSCSNPNFSFFQVNGDTQMNNNTATDNNTNSKGNDDNKRFLDVASALVAASKIAALSMSKAAAMARVEAERRVKEAALAKKRAREALERLLYLAAEEKERELKKGSVGVLVKSNNGKNVGEKSSNGLYPVPSGAVAGHYQHQESNPGIGK
ncbi:hypothetical protein Pint_24184 [Pistacia integerrima]|uniref:Uncharacterized protein n=1 Tax=Pistacia integerrima TaxID=434235 RepID=A0ACC0YGY7_9ROSI|nr:hypothetical protein Pint_24184 [Pistacia integerrima]